MRRSFDTLTTFAAQDDILAYGLSKGLCRILNGRSLLLGAGKALSFGKDSRAHRGRNSRLAHRARQDSTSFSPAGEYPHLQ